MQIVIVQVRGNVQEQELGAGAEQCISGDTEVGGVDRAGPVSEAIRSRKPRIAYLVYNIKRDRDAAVTAQRGVVRSGAGAAAPCRSSPEGGTEVKCPKATSEELAPEAGQPRDRGVEEWVWRCWVRSEGQWAVVPVASGAWRRRGRMARMARPHAPHGAWHGDRYPYLGGLGQINVSSGPAASGPVAFRDLLRGALSRVCEAAVRACGAHGGVACGTPPTRPNTRTPTPLTLRSAIDSRTSQRVRTSSRGGAVGVGPSVRQGIAWWKSGRGVDLWVLPEMNARNRHAAADTTPIRGHESA